MDIISRDLKYIWHPCSQMKDFEKTPPLVIEHAKGSVLYTDQGQPIIDAISSWWCKSLGHSHPRLKQALFAQAERYEHAILANTTNDVIVELSERLSQIRPPLSHALYASDGSCAVEMALKMSVHAHQLQGNQRRTQFATLQNSYHGETALALGVSDIGHFRKIYQDILIQPTTLHPLPYCLTDQDPAWQDCGADWPQIESQLESVKSSLAAIIIEPILQGAGNMSFYSPDLLRRLNTWGKINNVYVIVDEILTGFGRLGHATACEVADITPDFICLGKGLTAGYLPLSAMLTSDEIFDLFYRDYESGKSFLHSHTHSGNCLAASVALETLKVLEEDCIYQRVRDNASYLYESMLAIAKTTSKLNKVRSFGWVVAADLDTSTPRAGYAVYQAGLKLGALLRPLGNTIYWLPPLNIDLDTITQLSEITQASLESCVDVF